MSRSQPQRQRAGATGGGAGWRWRLRRGFWNGFAVLKFKGQKPEVIPVPEDGPAVRLVPFRDHFPDIPIDGPVVADRIPADEAHPGKLVFTRVQRALVRGVSPMQADVPAVPDDPSAAVAQAYSRRHRRCFPLPTRPDLGLGAMAVASPYASYLEAAGNGGYRWDLAFLGDFEVHPGLVPLGAVVDFVAGADGGLDPVRIETALGVAEPGGAGWDEATRLAMCSITSHTSMVRHFSWLHLTCGPRLEAVTRNRLRADHPVRRLLWPHVYGTHNGNQLVTDMLVGPGGDFESMFSLTHRALCQLYEATTGDMDLAAINPVLDRERRGLTGAPIATPALDSWTALYDVYAAHARRYLERYYASDDAVRDDQALGAWIEDLDGQLPNGVGAVAGEQPRFDGVAALLATVGYLATVEHEITGSGLWSYQLWNDASPVRVHADGRRVPVDVYQRLVNANFILNVHRTMLLDDALPTMALDAKGASAFVEFQQDLLGLQARLDQSPPAPWRIEPRHLKANINA